MLILTFLELSEFIGKLKEKHGVIVDKVVAVDFGWYPSASTAMVYCRASFATPSVIYELDRELGWGAFDEQNRLHGVFDEAIKQLQLKTVRGKWTAREGKR